MMVEIKQKVCMRVVSIQQLPSTWMTCFHRYVNARCAAAVLSQQQLTRYESAKQEEAVRDGSSAEAKGAITDIPQVNKTIFICAQVS